jgi:hypothetical protein
MHPVLPEWGDNAQQGLIQSYAVLGVVSQNPVVTAEGYQAASSRGGTLQGEAIELGSGHAQRRAGVGMSSWGHFPACCTNIGTECEA